MTGGYRSFIGFWFGGLSSAGSTVATTETSDDEVYCLVGLPFDITSSISVPGPPFPFGIVDDDFDLDFEIIGGVGGAATFYASAGKGAYRSLSGDNPSLTYFPPRLISVFNFTTRLFQGGEPQARTRPGFGDITLDNSDGTFDDVIDFGWDGRELALYRGRNGLSFQAFTLVFKGTCDGLSTTENSISFRLRDREAVFNKPIQTALYGGGGAAEGDSNIQGRPKPQAYGLCRNLAPVLIDSANLVYQFHDRQANAVTAVRDKGAALVYSGLDVANYSALIGLTAGSGQQIDLGEYATCLAQGLIRLAASPVGLVTMDVQGDAAGGYVQTHADIARRIAQSRLGDDSLTDAQLDQNSFSDLNTAAPGAAGLYIDTPMNVDQAMDILMQSVGGTWSINLIGTLRVAQFYAAASPIDIFYPRNIGESPAKLVTYPRVSYSRRIGYRRVWRPQSAAELVAPPTISESDREFYGKPIRYVSSMDNEVQAKHKLATETTIDGLYDSISDAQSEANRQQALYGTERSITSFSMLGKDLFGYDLGDTIQYQPDSVTLLNYVLIALTVDVSRNVMQVEMWQ